MIQRRLTIGFLLLAFFIVLQGIVIIRVERASNQDIQEIVEFSSPILITSGLIQAQANNLLNEAVSVAFLITTSEEALALEVAPLPEGAVNPEDTEEENTLEEGSLEAITLETQIEIYEYFESQENIEALLATYAGLQQDASALVADLEAAVEETFAEGLRLIQLAVEGEESDELIEQKERLEDAEGRIQGILETIITQEQRQLEALTASSNQATEEAVTLSILLILLTLLAALVISYFTSRGIIQPVRTLEAIMGNAEKGHFDVRAEEIHQGEIGNLEHAYNRMLDAIQERDSELTLANALLEIRVMEANTARQQAEKADQAKSAFLASVSHEFRTPLNAIINYSKFVARGVMGPVTERQEETLGRVVNSAQHLLALINDVLDMAKIESGSLNLFVEDNINLNEILQQVMKTAESSLADKAVRLEHDIAPDLPLLKADRKRMMQIFLNVVSNACKFTQNGFVRIVARVEDEEILVTVQDTGPGIAPKDHEAIFEVFKQSDTGLRQGEGTGLGMPISKNLAEAHGGRLWFESEVGTGTTFYITLPVKSDLLVPVI